MTIIIQRFRDNRPPLTTGELASAYSLPIRLVTTIVDRLHEANLIHYVILSKDETGLTPAVDSDTLTLGELIRRIASVGKSDFIPDFEKNFASIITTTTSIVSAHHKNADNILLYTLPIYTPDSPKIYH